MMTINRMGDLLTKVEASSYGKLIINDGLTHFFFFFFCEIL